MSEELNENIISLEDENGQEQDFEHIDTLELDGETYVALVPVDESEEGELIVLKIVGDEDGEEVLSSIDDDAEYNRVVEKFTERLSEDYDIVQ